MAADADIPESIVVIVTRMRGALEGLLERMQSMEERLASMIPAPIQEPDPLESGFQSFYNRTGPRKQR